MEIEFIIVFSGDYNALIRAIASIMCVAANKRVNVIYNEKHKAGLKAIKKLFCKFNPEVPVTFKQYALSDRCSGSSIDALMLKKWIVKSNITDSYVCVCDTSTSLEPSHFTKASKCLDREMNLVFIGQNPLIEQLASNSLFSKSTLRQVPNKAWRDAEGIEDVLRYAFSNFCQSKDFFNNYAEAENNRKFKCLNLS